MPITPDRKPGPAREEGILFDTTTAPTVAGEMRYDGSFHRAYDSEGAFNLRGVRKLAAFPGSPTQGDLVVLTTNDTLYYYDGANWVPAGVTSQQLGGFISESTSNYYELSSAAAMPGADDFVAVAMAVPLADRSAGDFEPIFSKVDSGFTSGWYLAWSYGLLEAFIVLASGSITLSVPVGNYDANRLRGFLTCVGLRVYSSGGDVYAELWVGPARYQGPNSVTSTVAPNTADAGRALSSAVGFTTSSNAIFAGIGYYEGTVTTAQMREIMGRCVAQSTIPEDLIAWDSVYQGQDVSTAPATWTPSMGTGTMAEVGTCEGVAGFFPPGAGGNNVITASGGGTPTLVIGTVEPTPATGDQVLWVDTSGGNVTLNLVTGD